MHKNEYGTRIISKDVDTNDRVFKSIVSTTTYVEPTEPTITVTGGDISNAALSIYNEDKEDLNS